MIRFSAKSFFQQTLRRVLFILVCVSSITGCIDRSPEEVKRLIEQTESKDIHQRNLACLSLASIGPEAKAAVPALALLLRDENYGVRSSAAYALRSIKTKEAIQALDSYVK